MDANRYPRRLSRIALLVLTVLGILTALVVLTRVPYGCVSLPPELRAASPDDPFVGVSYNQVSHDGTYVAATRRAGSRGCEFVLIYSCRARETLYELGCVNDIFPAESRYWVNGAGWISDNHLRISYWGDPSSNGTYSNPRTATLDMTDTSTFDTFLGVHWRDVREFAVTLTAYAQRGN